MSVTVVIPLCIYMFVGFLIRRFGIFSADHFRALNKMLFQVFIPFALFSDIYQADVGESLKPKVFAGVLLGIIAVYLVTWFIMSRTVKDKRDVSVLTQGIYRSNYVLFGSTIASHLCGQAGIATVSALAAFVVPLFNILAVILFETYRGEKINFGTLLINILKNPLVDAGLLGIFFGLLPFQIPDMILNPIIRMGNAATPMALVSLGGMLSMGSLIRDKKYIFIGTLGRLVIVPAAALSIAIFLGLRGDTLVAILAVFGSPTAVASGPMAQAMGGNGELAGEIVASTSICCVITIFLFVFGLLNLGLI